MIFWKLKCFSFFLCLSCFHFNKLQISFKLQKLYAWLVTYLDHSVLRTKLPSLYLCFSLSSAFAQKLYDMIYRSSWSRGSVPSSHARGQRFKPRRRQYFKLLWPRRFFTPTPAESLPNLNPAFLLSASHPFNQWPSAEQH